MTVDRRLADPVIEIEVVCTANICRSPVAQAMLVAAALERLGDDPPVLVRSSGVDAVGGMPAAEGSRFEAARRGLDLSRHLSARVDPEQLADADLVLTMSERHRGRVAQIAPETATRSFTLRELARLLTYARPTLGGNTSPRARVRSLVAAAHDARPIAPRPTAPEDVDDPIGGPPRAYARMATDLEDLIRRIADELFGPAQGLHQGLLPTSQAD